MEVSFRRFLVYPLWEKYVEQKEFQTKLVAQKNGNTYLYYVCEANENQKNLYEHLADEMK